MPVVVASRGPTASPAPTPTPSPTGWTVGTLYMADAGNHHIRKLTAP